MQRLCHPGPPVPSAATTAAAARRLRDLGRDGQHRRSAACDSGDEGRRLRLRVSWVGADASELWLADVARIDATAAFAIADPLTRFRCVNEPHERRAATQPLTRTLPPWRRARPTTPAAAGRGGVAVLDLLPVDQDRAGRPRRALRPALAAHREVGHHRDGPPHQSRVAPADGCGWRAARHGRRIPGGGAHPST